MTQTDQSPAGNLSGKYCAVIQNEYGETFVIKHNNAEDLASTLRWYCGTKATAFPFVGDVWAISKGPKNRWLLGPNGEQYPLFNVEPCLEADPSGSLDDHEASPNAKVKR